MQRWEKIYIVFMVVGMISLLLTAGMPRPCSAVVTEEQMKNWPVPCYQGEELQKVREWEKTWVGKKINQDNIDQVKEFLSDQFYEVFKNPQDWGATELFFSIVPYQQVSYTPGVMEATRKYAPTAKLDPNPRKAYWKGEVLPNEFLVGWDKAEGAGIPFPFPQSGVEIAWNMESSNQYGDTRSVHRDGVVVNPRTKAERRAIQPWIHDYYTRRCDFPPMPNKPDNAKGLRRAMFLEIVEPLDVKDTRYMELRYLDVTKPEDVWIWFPLFRRIRRMGVVYKSDTIDGTDLGPDDEMGWNGHTNVKNWNIVGRKEMLVGRHEDTTKYTKEKGQAVWNGYQMERLNTYVVECKWKDPNASYSKEVLYFDPELWRALQKVTWDRQGRVWRQFFYHREMLKTKDPNVVISHCFELYSMDLQRRHGSPTMDKMKEAGKNIDNSFWTIQNLQKLGF